MSESDQRRESPYRGQASHMINILVREIPKTGTWKELQDIIEAISCIRYREGPMTTEWEYHYLREEACTPE